MTSLHSVAAIRAAEQEAAKHLPDRTLMLRAARAVSRRALEMSDGPFLVLAGPGNNGGDALEAALNLHEAFREVVVAFFGTAAHLPADAQAALHRAQSASVRVVQSMPSLTDFALVIDGLFGIGLTRPVSGIEADAVRAVGMWRGPVLSIDVPSGIDAQTGMIVGGTSGVAVRADETLTFIGGKPGLFTGAGVDHAGRVVVDPLGIESVPQIAGDPAGDLNHPGRFADAIEARLRNSHKGSFGSVAILGANTGMSGAGILAARAALYAGAGRIYLHPLGAAMTVDALHPEIMVRPASAISPAHVAVAGPGMGRTDEARALLARVIDEAGQLVLDADALNLVAEDSDIETRLRARAERSDICTLMTPHPLEAARLLHASSEAVSADRLASARTLAARYRAGVVLKGAGSVMAFPDQSWSINPTGNPGLASGGTGDVLAGLVGALLAQFADPVRSLRAAVWLHGAAADGLVRRGVGPIGLTASELLPEIRKGLNDLVAANSSRRAQPTMRPAAI